MAEEKSGFVRIPNAEANQGEGGVGPGAAQAPTESFPPLTWPLDHVTQQTLRRWLDINGVGGGSGGGGNGGGTTGGSWYGYETFTGTITSTSAAPETALLTSIPTGTSALLSIAVNARNATDGLHAAFLRNVKIKNVAGVLSLYDQIQDAFTMRDDDWSVDVTFAGGAVYLRVWGTAADTIVWKYSASVIPG